MLDLHGGGSVYKDQIAKVVDITNSLNPDVILIVGDAVDAPRALIESRMDPLKCLHARIGTFFTTGNHEYYYGSALEWFDHFKNSYGITILDNK
uniref:Calcineurin-like phosphoesterase domain-containing protein n=1 Tax=Acrobeloides nanus TaxID=290746 RepID=A0A914EJN2_9BILA